MNPLVMHDSSLPNDPSRWSSSLPTLIAVGGCKGGVGKSMVALALVDYLLRRDVPVLLIETDTANPDVWRMYAREEGVVAEALDLDRAEGWIDLINLCDAHPERVAVINTAARNNKGVAAHGATLNRALPELRRRLVTLWVINPQRDSLELLEDYLHTLPDAVTHVIRNTFFGSPDLFGLYPTLAVSEEIARRGGQVLTLDRLADRVSNDLYSRRLAIARAVQRGGPDALPLGNRAELERWREEVAGLFEAILPVELPPTERQRQRFRCAETSELQP
ncbi:MAG: protein mobD [Candidatus Contendobacter sp.]